MMLRVTAAFFLGFGWLGLLPIFDTPDARWPWLLVAGVMALAAAERRQGNSWVAAGTRGLAGAFAVGAAQGLVVAAFWEWGHQFHAFDLFGLAVYPLIKLVTPEAAWIGGTITLPDGDYLYDFIPSFEILATFPALLLLVGIGMLVRPSMRQWLQTIVAVGAYLALRVAVLYLACVRVENTDLIWKHELAFVSFLPLVVLLGYLLRAAPPANLFPSGLSRPLLAGSLACLAVAAFGATFLRLYEEPGERKAGRVLIDEGHSQWERTDVPMNRELYGEGTVYNFYCFYQWLDLYYDMARTEEALTTEALSNVDVLILKTPTRAYEDVEIDAIEDFVRGGGGLVMIGDHTNVFGMSTYLNAIGERFGMRFVADATYGLGTMALTYYEPPPLAKHPILEDIDFFSFATSCSMQLDPACRSFMTGYRLLSLMADYSQRSFFTEPIAQRDYTFGLFSQGAVRRAGKGRVVSFTDSTNFSNFFMFIRGKPELALGMVEWANRTNRFGVWNLFGWVLLAFGLSGTLVSYLRWGGGQSPGRVLVASALLLGVTGGVVASQDRNRSAAESPRPRPHDRIEVLAAGDYALPEGDPALFNPSPGYDTFYTWIARTGAFPAVVDHIGEDGIAPSAILWLRPPHSLPRPISREVEAYLQEGGMVMIVGDHEECEAVEVELGLRSATGERDDLAHVVPAIEFARKEGPNELTPPEPPAVWPGISIPNLDDSLSVAKTIQEIHLVLQAMDETGPETLLATPSVYERAVGKGRVLFFSQADLFANRFMGGTSVIPNVLHADALRLPVRADRPCPGTGTPRAVVG